MPDQVLIPHARNKTIPGPSRYPLIGVIPQLWKTPLELLTHVAQQYGGIAHLGGRRWGLQWFLLSDPEYIRYVLQEHYRNYRRGLNVASLGQVLFGNGLPLNEGASWLRQRRLMQPAFHAKRIAALESTMARIIAAMLERWQTSCDQGAVLNIEHEMTDLTRDIVVQAMFSTDIEHARTQELGPALLIAMQYINFVAAMPQLPLWVPTPRNRAFRNAVQTLNRIVYQIIEARRHNGIEADDLFSMLLAARDEDTGAAMSDQQLRDEVMSIFIAGHETVSTALAWIWYLLAAHPEVEHRLHTELDQVLGGRRPGMADLPGLPYTRMVIEEALRLYPPAWITSRSPIADDEIGGYHIPARAILFISPYVMHRHPAFWDAPETFDPERFRPERAAHQSRFIYMPFGAGPRQCIGNTFAMTEMQLIVAMIAQSYRLRLVPNYQLELRPLASLRLRHGMPMTLERRHTGDHQ